MQGRVDVDGTPIAHGSMSLLPAEGNSGPAANTTIVDGEYMFSHETGPHSGPHRVLIDVDTLPAAGPAMEKNEAGQDFKAVNPRASRSARKAPQAKPVEKRRWELPYTVPLDGPVQKDFHLDG